MGVKFAVAELDLQIAEPLIVEVPLRHWSARVISGAALMLLPRSILIAIAFCPIVHGWREKGLFCWLDHCRFAKCRFFDRRLVDYRFVDCRLVFPDVLEERRA
jgi:hypothetical protein